MAAQGPSLDPLPHELLHMVNQLLDFDSLHNLSLVNRRIRVTCSPFLFRCVSIDFSSPSFEALIALTQSPVANHVKALKYYASDLLQPRLTGALETVYSPTSYARDQWEDIWKAKGGEDIQYFGIPPLVEKMFEDHSVIMDNGTDMAVLTAVMQRLPKLSKLILRYGQDRNMRNTSKPVLPDCLKTVLTYRRDSIGHHLTACFQAIRPLGQIASQPITSLEISALKNKDIARYHSLAVVAEEAFSWIETLTIREFPSSFGYLVTEEITMPQLRKLAVTTDGGSMSLSHLKAFATETVEVSSSSHSVPASGC